VADRAAVWAQYSERKSEDLRSRLISEHAYLARYVVDRLNLKTSAGVDYDDLLSQAVVGLIDAVDRYDPFRGVKFETYAYVRIRGAVVDMLREMDWSPRSVRQKENELKRAYASIEVERGRPATDDEAAAALGITRTELDALAQEVAPWAMVSLEETISSGGDDDDLTVADLIEDEVAVSPESHAEQREMTRLLVGAIKGLPEQERLVLSLYYIEGLTLKEAGKALGVTESRACQVHSKAILRLQTKLERMLAAA
jgi:RNA polymerase sigma factor for flagellar operon FliA